MSSSLIVKVFHSTSATYHTSSDLLGIEGMHHEWIRATLLWKNGASRYNCVFIDCNSEVDSFASLNVACIKQFISFGIKDTKATNNYSCALVE